MEVVPEIGHLADIANNQLQTFVFAWCELCENEANRAVGGVSDFCY